MGGKNINKARGCGGGIESEMSRKVGFRHERRSDFKFLSIFVIDQSILFMSVRETELVYNFISSKKCLTCFAEVFSPVITENF